MGDPNILFGFDDPSEKDKAVKSTQHWFSCLGASVSCRSTFRRRPSERRGRRTAEVNLTVTDSQTGTPRAASSSGTDRSPARFATRLSRQGGARPIPDRDRNPAGRHGVDCLHRRRPALQSGSHRGSLDCGWNVDRHETDAPKHENQCRVVFTALFLADRLSRPKSMFWPPVGFPCAANDPTTVTEPEEAERPVPSGQKVSPRISQGLTFTVRHFRFSD